MAANLKELIVVLVIGAVVFHFAKPIALRFSTARDFSRRRNIWLILTATAFLSPNFWWFALLAAPLLAWGGRKDSNAVAFYLLLLHVIPQVSVSIPVTGIGELFSLDNYRLLSFCVLIPTALRLRRSSDATRIRGLTMMDILLLGYGVLQIALFIPPDVPNHVLFHDSSTNVLRRAFLFFVDVYALYFVVSRSCSNRRAIVETLAAFCLAGAIMALTACFETLRHWLLYADIQWRWSAIAPPWGFYILRGGVVRAQASAGHPLALGYLLAIAFGFWLYLQSRVKSTALKVAVALLLWIGLLSAYSRGPWVGAVAIYFTFAAVGARAFPRLLKAITVAVLVAGVISATPLGDRIIKVFPLFGGSVDSYNISYRERLAERSWELIQERPFFGDQSAYSKMEDLRQGQGIIDLVNSYAQVALDYGLVGLSLFIAFVLLGLYKAYQLAKEMMQSDPDLALLGVSLVASVIGTLLMMASTSFMLGIQKGFYILAGLTAAYGHLQRLPETRVAIYRSIGVSRETR